MDNWFTIEQLDNTTHVISEYGHREETHCYLLSGRSHSLLIDTGLGIENIHEQVVSLTDRPIIAVATHAHWDHIGGHRYFPDFCAQENEVSWLAGAFPLSEERVRELVLAGFVPPEDFNIDRYTLFRGAPSRVLTDGDIIDIGGREIEVLHTPGHSPGHMCFFERERGYLFTGDLIYAGTLYMSYPSTDPAAYLTSVRRVSALPVKRVLPAHHELNIPVHILDDVRQALCDLEARDKLRHGSGRFDYGGFSVML